MEGGYKKFDWLSAERNGSLAVFSAEIKSRLEPLNSRVYEDAESTSYEIEQVASILKETADRLLPSFEPQSRKKWKDDVLSCLCVKSRQACMTWKSALSLRKSLDCRVL